MSKRLCDVDAARPQTSRAASGINACGTPTLTPPAAHRLDEAHVSPSFPSAKLAKVIFWHARN